MKPIPSTLCSDGEIFELRTGGQALAEDNRKALLARVRAGEPMELEVDALVFRQHPTKPNRNFTRFADKVLPTLAASYTGAPFMRDHERDLLARGGTVVSSELSSVRGSPVFRQTLHLVKPWAVEAALDGTLDRFSIAWSSQDPVLCSVCGKDMFSAQCSHYPGDRVKVDGADRTVEAVFQSAEGVETSAVVIPAVPGTAVEEIRTALAAARAEFTKEKPDMKDIAKSLGLAEDTTKDAILAEVAKAQGEIASLRAAHASTLARAEKAEGELAAAARAAEAAAVDQLIDETRREGKTVLFHDSDGKLVDGPVEKAIRMTAANSGLANAKEYVTTLPRVTPAGAPSQAAGVDPTPRAPVDGKMTETQALESLSDAERSAAKQGGLTALEFLAAKKRRGGR